MLEIAGVWEGGLPCLFDRKKALGVTIFRAAARNQTEGIPLKELARRIERFHEEVAADHPDTAEAARVALDRLGSRVRG